MYYPIEPYDKSSCPTCSIMKDASLGAMVGATAAAAMQLKKADDKRGGENAVGEILRTGVASGLATAAASAVGNAIGQKNTLTTVAAMFAAGTAMMYLLGSNTATGDK